MRTRRLSVVLPMIVGLVAVPLFAAERHMMQPRVPADKLAEARALKNPLSATAEVVEKGRVLYEGKGTCINCHGVSGRGDGPAAASLDPSPRNFHHRGFWMHRSDGEIFWVIKNGSPGTAMIGFGNILSDDEIWSIMQYEETFAGGRGPRRGMGPSEGMGRMGPREGMRGMMGPRGPMGGMGPGEGECCEGRETER